MIRKIASVAEVAYLHVLVYSGLTNQVNQNASMCPGHRKVISRVLSMSARSSVSAGLLTKQKGDCLWNAGSAQSVNMFMTLPLVILIVESLPEPHLNHCLMIGAAHCVALARMYLKKSNNLLLFLIESPRLRGLFCWVRSSGQLRHAGLYGGKQLIQIRTGHVSHVCNPECLSFDFTVAVIKGKTCFGQFLL